EIHLIDNLGKTVLLRSKNETQVDAKKLEEFEKSLLAGSFNTGVRDWDSSGQSFIVGYKRLGFGQLMVVSLIPRELAFVAAKRLIVRSVVLGASIFLLAIGLTLLFAKGLTRRIREMWHATLKVAEGNFTVRVSLNGASEDEVTGLGRSFNTMADKIDDLMRETAQKARMEKELETAQMVQSKFFPTEAYEHPNFKLSGKYLPASECAGDWWHYAQIGPYLITVVGDVTGHGVSAALVTASVHGAFAILMDQIKDFDENDTELLIQTLMKQLNAAVCASASGGSSMTFITSVTNLNTGVMTYANASHLPPYLYRPDAGGTVSILKQFKPLMAENIPAFGRGRELAVKTTTFQLSPGDTIFWFTDGINEDPAAKTTRSSRKVFEIFARATQSAAQNPQGICEKAIAEVLEGMGSAARPDDITLVVASIPAAARFQAAPVKTAAA
ncbi:MAG: PP2C family protein-serine/threonine phosphatase, partial [Bdellovibrionota bacterium]